MKHQHLVRFHRGTVFGTCSCGWVGKETKGLVETVKLWEIHREQVMREEERRTATASTP